MTTPKALASLTLWAELKLPARYPAASGVFRDHLWVLSSTAFLFYFIFFFANDLSLFGEGAAVVQYADDTQVLVSGKNPKFVT